MLFNYRDDPDQYGDRWYVPERHDVFLYSDPHPTTGAIQPTGRNPYFFTGNNPYNPDPKSRTYDFKYPVVDFSCVSSQSRRTPYVPNGGCNPCCCTGKGYYTEDLDGNPLEGKARYRGLRGVVGAAGDEFGCEYYCNDIDCEGLSDEEIKELLFSEETAFDGNDYGEDGPDEDTWLCGSYKHPDGFDPYSGRANSPRWTAVTPITLIAPAHYGGNAGMIGRQIKFYSGTPNAEGEYDYQYVWVHEIHNVGRYSTYGMDDSVLLNISAARKNFYSNDVADYTGWLGDHSVNPVDASGVDIAFPYFLPEVYPTDVINNIYHEELNADDAFMHSSRYRDIIMKNFIMYSFDQDNRVGIGGCDIINSSSDGRPNKMRENIVPVPLSHPDAEPSTSLEYLLGTQTHPQLAILEDAIGSGNQYKNFANYPDNLDYPDPGWSDGKVGDSGSPCFTHCAPLTGTSPIWCGFAASGGDGATIVGAQVNACPYNEEYDSPGEGRGCQWSKIIAAWGEDHFTWLTPPDREFPHNEWRTRFIKRRNLYAVDFGNFVPESIPAERAIGLIHFESGDEHKGYWEDGIVTLKDKDGLLWEFEEGVHWFVTAVQSGATAAFKLQNAINVSAAPFTASIGDDYNFDPYTVVIRPDAPFYLEGNHTILGHSPSLSDQNWDHDNDRIPWHASPFDGGFEEIEADDCESPSGDDNQEPFHGEILQWHAPASICGAWNLGGLQITGTEADPDFIAPQDGWTLTWKTSENAFVATDIMVDELPIYEYDDEHLWLADMEDIENYIPFPPCISPGPGSIYSYCFEIRPSHAEMEPTLQGLDYAAKALTWNATTEKWGPFSVDTWNFQHWYQGSESAEIIEIFYTGNHTFTDLHNWYKETWVPRWDGLLGMKRMVNLDPPYDEGPILEANHGAFTPMKPLYEETADTLDLAYDTARQGSLEPDIDDPGANLRFLDVSTEVSVPPQTGDIIPGAEVDPPILRVMRNFIGNLGNVQGGDHGGIATGTMNPRTGTAMRYDTVSDTWIPNKLNTGIEPWSRDTYVTHLNYDEHFIYPDLDYVQRTTGDSLISDIYIPTDCSITGYKIFDCSKLIGKRLSTSPYLSPLWGNNPNDCDDPWCGHPWLEDSALPPHAVVDEPQDGVMTQYQGMNWDENLRFYHDSAQDMMIVAFSMVINIFRVQQDWTDETTASPEIVTPLASGVTYSDNPSAEWITFPSPVELNAGDSIRVAADLSYQEASSVGDYLPGSEPLVGGDYFSHPPGLKFEWGNIHGPTSPPIPWLFMYRWQKISKTSIHIKLDL